MGLLLLRTPHIYLLAVVIQGCYGKYRFTEPAQNYTVIASEDSIVTLRCRFADAANLKKVWMNGSTILFVKDQKISGNNRVTVLQDNYQEFSIRIRQINKYDEGEYSCTIYDDDTAGAHITQTMYLTVHVPAYLTFVSDKVKIVNEGDKFFLKCMAEGKPKPVIRWRHLVPSGDGVMGTGTHLPIFNITREGEGIYECSADNNMGSPQVHTIQIYVKYSPEMHRRRARQLVSSELGKSIVLECTASSYPLPTFVWKRGDIVYKARAPSSRVQVATAIYRKYTVRSKLNIDKVENDDFGKYVCIAENEKGKANMSITFSKVVPMKRIPPYKAFSSTTKTERQKGENAASRVRDGLQLFLFVTPLIGLQLFESL